MGISFGSRDGRMRLSLRSLLAFHRADISGVDSGFFGFQEAAEDFAGACLQSSGELGVAIGASSRRTCSINAAASASEGTWSERTWTKALMHSLFRGSGTPMAAASATARCETSARDFRGSDAVSGDIQYVGGAAEDCDVSVFVFHGDVASDIAAGEKLPVSLISSRVARRCAACMERDASTKRPPTPGGTELPSSSSTSAAAPGTATPTLPGRIAIEGGAPPNSVCHQLSIS